MIYQNLVILIDSAIHNNNKLKDLCYRNLNWPELYKEAEAHHIVELLYSRVASLDLSIRPDEELLQLWKKQTIVAGSMQYKHMEDIKEVLQKFRNASIPIIPLKGLVLRELYPNPELRTMVDADLLVHKEDFEKASEILISLGYLRNEKSTEKEIHFYHKSKQLIELHWLAIEPKSISDSQSFEKSVWENAVEANVADVPVLIMSINETLIHIIMHMVFHIKYSGFGLKQLCDLVLFVEANRNAIDWDTFINQISKYKIEKFSSAIFLICKKLFSLKVPVNAFIEEDEYFMDLLLEDIFSAGAHGHKDKTRDQVNEMIAFIKDDSWLFSVRFKHYIAFLFPTGKQISEKYLYSAKCPLLLPVAWIHRLANNIASREFKRTTAKHINIPKEAIPIYRKRSKLLKWLDLR